MVAAPAQLLDPVLIEWLRGFARPELLILAYLWYELNFGRVNKALKAVEVVAPIVVAISKAVEGVDHNAVLDELPTNQVDGFRDYFDNPLIGFDPAELSPEEREHAKEIVAKWGWDGDGGRHPRELEMEYDDTE